MTYNSFKPGVKVGGISPEMSLAFSVVASVFQSYGLSCIVTSGLDGKHSTNSLHYSGRALDFRTRHVSPGVLFQLVHNVKEALGPEFDVVNESTHLHVEFDPK